jgi:hypothetical protein
MAFCSNAAATVMLLFNLNPAVNLIFCVPAACITCSAASRAFIRLSTWAPPDVYMHQSALINSTRAGTTHNKSSPNTQVAMAVWARPTKSDIETGFDTRLDPDLNDFETKPNTRTVNFAHPTQHGQNGVMVTMDTFSHANDDEIKRTLRPQSSGGSSSTLEFDSTTPRGARLSELNDAHQANDAHTTHTYGDGKPTAAARF